MKEVTSYSQEGPIPQDTECSGTSNSGFFVSRGSQISCTLQTQPAILPHPSVGSCPWDPRPSSPGDILHHWRQWNCRLSSPLGGLADTRVSWECGTFHTHPLHCSALPIHWEVSQQHLSAITLQTERQMQFANGTEGFYKYLHFKHIYSAFTGICQLNRIWWVSKPWTLEQKDFNLNFF